jgi:hypothetical protein
LHVPFVVSDIQLLACISAHAADRAAYVLVFVDTPFEICQQRNAQRPERDRVPDEVMHRMRHAIEHPAAHSRLAVVQGCESTSKVTLCDIATATYLDHLWYRQNTQASLPRLFSVPKVTSLPAAFFQSARKGLGCCARFASVRDSMNAMDMLRDTQKRSYWRLYAICNCRT